MLVPPQKKRSPTVEFVPSYFYLLLSYSLTDLLRQQWTEHHEFPVTPPAELPHRAKRTHHAVIVVRSHFSLISPAGMSNMGSSGEGSFTESTRYRLLTTFVTFRHSQFYPATPLERLWVLGAQVRRCACACVLLIVYAGQPMPRNYTLLRQFRHRCKFS